MTSPSTLEWNEFTSHSSTTLPVPAKLADAGVASKNAVLPPRSRSKRGAFTVVACPALRIAAVRWAPVGGIHTAPPIASPETIPAVEKWSETRSSAIALLCLEII